MMSGGSNKEQQRPVDDGLLQEIKKNMEAPEALRFRGNTGNKSYGFE